MGMWRSLAVISLNVYKGRLPDGVGIAEDERLVILPGAMLSVAKKDIPDA